VTERLYIYVKDWERFQPRSDRPGLPWLRLHTDLLANDDWIELAAAEKVLLTVIWMITQRHGNGRTVASERWLRGQAGLRHGHLEPLVEAGFITLSTTKAAPPRHQSGALEEKRIEKKKKKKKDDVGAEMAPAAFSENGKTPVDEDDPADEEEAARLLAQGKARLASLPGVKEL
jgi:hypothetical protein